MSEETIRQIGKAPVDVGEEGVGDGGQQVGDAGEEDLQPVQVLHRVGDEEAEQRQQQDPDGGAEVGGIGAGSSGVPPE